MVRNSPDGKSSRMQERFSKNWNRHSEKSYSRKLPLLLREGLIPAFMRWAWLLEGAARWFGGQTAHARPASTLSIVLALGAIAAIVALVILL